MSKFYPVPEAAEAVNRRGTPIPLDGMGGGASGMTVNFIPVFNIFY